MKNPADLSRDELIAMVSELLQLLYAHQQDDGTWCYATDKQWSGGDVCESVASLLDRFGLVPEPKDDGKVMQLASSSGLVENVDALQASMCQCTLAIDGPAFREQRELLLNLHRSAETQVSFRLTPDDRETLDGLINLTDALADQLHDEHGVDCLLEE